MFLVWFLVVILLIFIGFIINCFYKNPDTENLWDCFRFGTTKADVPDDVLPLSTKSKLCEFEGEDIFNKKVYTFGGTLVTEQPEKMTCNECNKYVYQKEPGECYDMGYDEEYQSKGTVVGVCSAAFTKKPCPF